MANPGVKCSRSRAIRKHGSSKSKELTEELKKMDVYCNYHPPYCGCSDRCWCSQALEKQECLRKTEIVQKDPYARVRVRECFVYDVCVCFYQETRKQQNSIFF